MPRFRSTAPWLSSEWMESGSSAGARPHEADAIVARQNPSLSPVISGSLPTCRTTCSGRRRNVRPLPMNTRRRCSRPVVLRLVMSMRPSIRRCSCESARRRGRCRGTRRGDVRRSGCFHDRRHLPSSTNGVSVSPKSWACNRNQLDAGRMADEPEAAAERRAVLRGVAAEIDADMGAMNPSARAIEGVATRQREPLRLLQVVSSGVSRTEPARVSSARARFCAAARAAGHCDAVEIGAN